MRFSADRERRIVCVANFSPVVREGYRVGLPGAGRWQVLLNSDARAYGGTDVGPGVAIDAEKRTWNGQEWSTALTLPPLGVLWLAPEESG